MQFLRAKLLLVIKAMVMLSAFAFFNLAFASSVDHISERAYWTDTSGLAGIGQAQDQIFTPYQGVLSKGFTNAAIWVRLTIKPNTTLDNADNTDKLVLRIRPIYLDEIQLFDPLDTSNSVRKSGDQINYSSAEYESLNHTFVIPMATQERHVYLRLQSTSTVLMTVEAFTPDDMLKAEHRMLVTYFAVMSLITVFLVMVFFNWLNHSESLYAVFVVRHLIYLIFTAAFFGFGRLIFSEWISPFWLDRSYNWLVIGTTAFSIWFEYLFLNEYRPPLWAKRYMQALLGISVVIAVLMMLGMTSSALKINMALNGLTIISLLILSAVFIKDQDANSSNINSLIKKRYVVGYYFVLNLILWTSVLPALGVIRGDEFALNALISYSLSSGILMTLLMQIRSNQLKQNNLQFSRDLLLSNQQVKLEKIKREEQSQLLAMLMHELKNPLAVIDLAQHADNSQETKNYVTRNVNTIKDILDRCLSADRISNGKMDIHREEVNLNRLVEEVLVDQADDMHRLQWHEPSTVMAVVTDAQCVRIALNNLIANALRYGDQTQPVIISMSGSQDSSKVCISVSNKPGISGWPDPDKLFQKYYRSTGAKSISGTGLGLFLVNSIAIVIGATCRYTPDDKHIRFELCLPH